MSRCTLLRAPKKDPSQNHPVSCKDPRFHSIKDCHFSGWGKGQSSGYWIFIASLPPIDSCSMPCPEKKRTKQVASSTPVCRFGFPQLCFQALLPIPGTATATGLVMQTEKLKRSPVRLGCLRAPSLQESDGRATRAEGDPKNDIPPLQSHGVEETKGWFISGNPFLIPHRAPASVFFPKGATILPLSFPRELLLFLV